MTRRLLRAPLLSLAAVAACHGEGERPGLIVLPGMATSVPYDPYDRNPVTGQTLLVPPEGTIPFGGERFLYGAGKEEAERAGRDLQSPIDTEAARGAQLPRGKKVYDTFCLVCHGQGGEGDGPIIGRFPNPPSLLSDKTKGMPEGQIYHVITRGQGLMPSYAAQIRAEDRWRAVLYVRWLQNTVGPSGESSTIAPGEEPPAKAESTNVVHEAEVERNLDAQLAVDVEGSADGGAE